ncbi:uncharacterized protein MYCFIDRAFT_179509 [Pseudocercospora fijiensis CIRAD86]|uniref:Uncharacterized protein n=1 Tax=Pseudocercospora fijiensis (strain CIRAD86) TaxID=383855 RepID=M2ZFY8_PSEFD|nr:uncharacterized protein MYCFIDRAFT_179509 [Pseudocercospora fijiensis CIRAD86]EME78064.1 hypothetical protein MYCFIDRAFT_179509 [Pseudocercospora fijiensis CIRAD86]
MTSTLSPTTSSSLSLSNGGLTIAILPLTGMTVTATAVPPTTGLAVVDGTTNAFRSDGITLFDGQVFSLVFDGLVDSSTTAHWTSVSLSTSLPEAHQDLRRRQDTEGASTPKDRPIQVEEPQTSSVPPDSPTNAYSSTAISLSSPTPSSYTGPGGTEGLTQTTATSTTLTGTPTSQATSSITITSETTLTTATGTKTVTSSATQSGSSATSSAGAAGLVQQQLSIEGWIVAALGLLATSVLFCYVLVYIVSNEDGRTSSSKIWMKRDHT